MTAVDEYRYATGDLAAEFKVHRKTIQKRAADLGLGIDFGGRAGRRFNEADRQRLIESLRPVAPTPARRRRRAA